MRLTVDGQSFDIDADPEMPLLWALRDLMGKTGPKFGCGIAACGACTVHIDGQPVRSCSLPVGQVTGAVTTIEGIGTEGRLHPVQQAWLEEQVQGTPGRILSYGQVSPGDEIRPLDSRGRGIAGHTPGAGTAPAFGAF